MAQPRSIEGTGEELERYLRQRPRERFRLVPLPTQESEGKMSPVPQERGASGRESETAEAKIARFRQQGLRGVGIFAHVPGGSEEFARQKQEEIEREDRPRS